jgi:hypothetical protein
LLNQTSRKFQILNPTSKSISVDSHCFAFSNHPFLPSTLAFSLPTKLVKTLNPPLFKFFCLFIEHFFPHFTTIDAFINILSGFGVGLPPLEAFSS